MRWTGHVVRTGERGGAYRILVGKPVRKRPLGNLGIDMKIILKCI
jgi:hypothetical protein